MTKAELEERAHAIGLDLTGPVRFPVFNPPAVERTPMGTPYLTGPGVAMIARPEVELQGLAGFLQELGGSEFVGYLADDRAEPLPPATRLSKFLGQLCYLALGEKRTKNAQSARYADNIKSSKHGSVLEHGNYTFLAWGVGRDFTHELVRHRAGAAFSQVSQRYVDGSMLRFVRRPEYADPILRARFEAWIDLCAAEYRTRADRLLELQLAGDPAVAADPEKKSDARKRVNQAARACLPNEAESPIGFTLNIRALRHVIEMRAARFADTPIRGVFYRVFLAMALAEPDLFDDCTINTLPDGSQEVVPKYSKV